MTFDPSLPYFLSIVPIATGFLPILFLPETLQHAKEKRSKQQDSASTDASDSDELSGKQEVLQELMRQMREFKDSTRFIWRDTNICWIIVVLFVSVMSRQSTYILLQYASKRFNWSIAKVSDTQI